MNYQGMKSGQTIIGYCRVSTELESQTQSLLGQSEEIQRYCDFHGHTLVASFEDRCSGRTECRDGLQKALDYQRENGGVIATTDLSRLARNVKTIADFIHSDVEFLLTRSGTNLTKTQIYLFVIIAEQFSDEQSCKVSHGIQNLFLRDPSARSRWGAGHSKEATERQVKLMHEGKQRRADAFAEAYGPLAFTAYQQGLSYRAVAAMLSDAGIETRRGKSAWSAKSTRALILRYQSLITPPDEPSEDLG